MSGLWRRDTDSNLRCGEILGRLDGIGALSHQHGDAGAVKWSEAKAYSAESLSPLQEEVESNRQKRWVE